MMREWFVGIIVRMLYCILTPTQRFGLYKLFMQGISDPNIMRDELPEYFMFAFIMHHDYKALAEPWCRKQWRYWRAMHTSEMAAYFDQFRENLSRADRNHGLHWYRSIVKLIYSIPSAEVRYEKFKELTETLEELYDLVIVPQTRAD